jgi:hypothetical protein
MGQHKPTKIPEEAFFQTCWRFYHLENYIDETSMENPTFEKLSFVACFVVQFQGCTWSHMLSG